MHECHARSECHARAHALQTAAGCGDACARQIHRMSSSGTDQVGFSASAARSVTERRKLSMMMTAGDEATAISYSTVIKACAEACNVVRAVYWIFMMLNVGIQANTIRVIVACAEACDGTGHRLC